jgi:hypothetical protein
MNLTDIIGSIGVSILLLAFFLNIMNIIHKQSFLYIVLNVLGAGLACAASVLLDYIPFIVLEAAWTLVSGIALIKKLILPKRNYI